MLLDGPSIWDRALAAFPTRNQPVAARVGRNVWATLRGYLRGILIVATFDATFIGLGFFALRVPLAGAIAVLIFFGAFGVLKVECALSEHPRWSREPRPQRLVSR